MQRERQTPSKGWHLDNEAEVALALALEALALALRLLRASASALPPLPRLPLQGGVRASQPLARALALALALAFLAL